MRRSALTVLLLGALSAGGCGGYTDDNWRAARNVAQAFLDAQQREDGAAACRLLAPETQAAFAAAAGGSCERALPAMADRSPARELDTASVNPAPGGGLYPRFGIGVEQQPHRLMIVGRYGSTWLVVDVGRAADS